MLFPTNPITTARLTLRPVNEHDAPALFPLYADAEAMRFWSRPPFTALSEAEQLVQRGVEGWEQQQSMMWVVEAEGVVAGTISLFSLSEQNRRAEIGYMLARPFWQQGIMSEALTAIIALAFGPMDLNRLEADIDPDNVASARLLQRLGFAHEGHLPQRWIVDGRVTDSDLYGLLKAHWCSEQAARSGCRQQ
ncbi:GNAT family N-acetyltransferase [Marinobacter hydrocarbonoclasticus]|nr:GNAT family N-acetyltransferase [Marinobacter nauticus]